MTWKTYATVSGATVLAGWLAAQAPSSLPAGAPAAPAADRAAAPSGLSDIEVEAARLQARVRSQIEYQQPERNPFRFGASRRTASAPAAMPVTPVDLAPIEVLPPPLPVTLSGIAEHEAGQRTAILSSPGGVLLVQQGDEVLGQFRIGAVDPDGVELLPLDGSNPIRLTFR